MAVLVLRLEVLFGAGIFSGDSAIANPNICVIFKYTEIGHFVWVIVAHIVHSSYMY